MRFLQRLSPTLAFVPLLLLAPPVQAETPAIIQALEAEGLTHSTELKMEGGLRAFAGMIGDDALTIYLLPDGTSIVGTRLNAQAQPLDEAQVRNVLVKPISDKAWAQLAAATWVRDGKPNAPRIIYTFSDPNCPYCHQFWEAARPWVTSGKVQLRHLLVGVIKADSPAKAAAILTASNPSAALEENEHKFDRGGITPAKTVSSNVRKTLNDNQTLMHALGFRGTPGIVVLDGNGLIQKHSGMPRPQALNQVFGPR